jgi:hypothetical protein
MELPPGIGVPLKFAADRTCARIVHASTSHLSPGNESGVSSSLNRSQKRLKYYL